MTTPLSPAADGGHAATDPALVDVRTVAAMCGCSTRHIYRLAAAGRMPAPVRLGALVRWNRKTIESWIDHGCPAVKRTEGPGPAELSASSPRRTGDRR